MTPSCSPSALTDTPLDQRTPGTHWPPDSGEQPSPALPDGCRDWFEPHTNGTVTGALAGLRADFPDLIIEAIGNGHWQAAAKDTSSPVFLRRRSADQLRAALQAWMHGENPPLALPG
jgi:hypothetical protein